MHQLYDALSDTKEASLYLHIPFCRRKCDYCTFVSAPADTETIKRYIQRVIQITGDLPVRRVPTVYIGGGDPSTLSSVQMEQMLKALKSFFDHAREVTLEMNPEGITKDLLTLITDLGVTRISLGIQSFDERARTIIGRSGSTKAVSQALGIIKTFPELEVNVDFITGIPETHADQTLKDFDMLFELFTPGHISLYELTIEQSTPLAERLHSALPEDTLTPAWEYLKRRGYQHYELSNFCLPGREADHNSRYWKLLPYVGIGSSAVSSIPRKDHLLRSTIGNCINGFIQQGMQYSRIEYIDGPTFLKELIMVSLRTKQGIPLEWISKVFGSSIIHLLVQRCNFWQKCGHMSKWALTESGFLIMNRIIIDFFECIDSVESVRPIRALDTDF